MIVQRNDNNIFTYGVKFFGCAATCFVAKIGLETLGMFEPRGLRRVSMEEWERMRTIGAIRDVSGVVMIGLIWASCIFMMLTLRTMRRR